MNFNLCFLSPEHPLRDQPDRPWPYEVLIGYRAEGSMKIIGRRSMRVRATSAESAGRIAMSASRDLGGIFENGVRLLPSRVITARPLDVEDAIRW